jgi:hypothetical protein
MPHRWSGRWPASSIAAIAIIRLIALNQRHELVILAKGNVSGLMQPDASTSTSDMRLLDRTAMRLVRRILALVIVLSVAMLPVAGSAAPAVSSAAQDPVGDPIKAEAAKTMVMSSEISAAMHDCCPDEANGRPCDHSTDQCPMGFCAAPPVSIGSPPVFQFDCPVVSANLLSIPVDQVVSLHSGSPPFRPPRV